MPRLVELRVADLAAGARRIRLALGNGVEVEFAEPMARAEVIDWIRELRSC